MLPQGPATRIIVPPNVEILAFLASFRAILTVFWADFVPLAAFRAFWAPFRPFGALGRHFRPICCAGPATRIIVPPNVEFFSFLASFVRFSQYFGQFLPLWALLGPFGPPLGPFRPFWSLFDPLSLVVSSPWWQAQEFEAI